MAKWWTKVVRDGIAEYEQHDTKVLAAIKLNFAHHLGKVSHEDMGLYSSDPQEHPDEPNLLPGEMERAWRKRDVRS